jgi:hypothetical protein
MKKTIIITTVLVVITLIACRTGCGLLDVLEDAGKEIDLEQEIIARACEEMEISSEGATLQLLWSEPIPWNEGDGYCYIMTAADKHYLVGVRRDKTTIFYVDVESEINFPEDWGIEEDEDNA